MAANAATVERRLGVMGTSLRLEVAAVDRLRALEASEAAVRAIEQTEQRLSTWRDDTELARLNRAPIGTPLELSVQTAADLELALTCAEVTGGAFDPTVGALIDAWGLRRKGRIPDPASLQRALGQVGHARLKVAGRQATRSSALKVEEGGFGKGAALDWAAKALEGSGATGAWLDLGGQVLVVGREAVVAIADPARRDRAALELVVSAGSVSTSGNSERGLRVDGQRLGHLLDPRTGRPAADLGSVTVLATQAAWADCLSTALYVLGPEAALQWVRGRPGIEVVVLEHGPGGLRARASAGLRGMLRPAPGATVQLKFDDAKVAR